VTGTLAVLIVATSLALLRGRSAPFWVGFAVAGWVNFLITLTPVGAFVAEWTPTAEIIEEQFVERYNQLLEPPVARLLREPHWSTSNYRHWVAWWILAQSLSTLIWGALGGWAAWALVERPTPRLPP
jgi:hypothetical protein